MKRFFSLRRKLLCAIIPLIAVPLLFSITMTYQVYMKQQQTEIDTFMHNMLEQVTTNLDRYTRELNSSTMEPLFDDNVMSVLERRRDAPEDIFTTNDERLCLSNFMNSLQLNFKEIKGYHLFCENGTIFSSSGYTTGTAWGSGEQEWMEKAESAGGAFIYLPPNIPDYYTSSREYVVSVAREICDPVTMSRIGFAKVDLTYQGFRNILYPDNDSQILFYIFDKDSQLIYPQDMGTAFMPKGKLVEINGRSYLAASMTSEYSGLSTYILYPYDLQMKGAYHIVKLMMSVSVISLLLACILAGILSRRMIGPIRYLEKMMNKLHNGDFSVRAQVKSHDEIGSLTIGFNNMAGEIDRLITEKYKVQLREKDAQILALQNQINPHFFYNALENISMTALNHDDIETSDSVARLGKMMRYTISRQKESVHLQTEVQFVEDYLAFQVLRLGERLRFEIHMDAALENCMVPKLILEPFVENVIEHAVGDSPVKVRLQAVAQWEDLLLIITDNGAGMSEERQKQVETNLYAEDAAVQSLEKDGRKSVGIALRNVHQRLRLMYGSPYGVTMNSEEGHGTTFILRLPLIWENESGEGGMDGA